MTLEQGLLFALLAAILGLLLWGRIRYDLVSAGGLLVAVLLGLVPQDHAFDGFSNTAVIIVALVLIASRAFENSGALALMVDKLGKTNRSTGAHIAVTSGVAAILSAIMNNVAALALLMPLDVQAARKAGRAAGLTLMPLSFATILGGMITLIGTPPNIIASAIRNDRLGMHYAMFDFAPVGLAVACAGVLFVALIGWRLVPRRDDNAAIMISESSFEAELLVPEESNVIGWYISELDENAEKSDVLILGLIREGKRYHRRIYSKQIEPGDILMIEGSTDAIASFIKLCGLNEVKTEAKDKEEDDSIEKPETDGKDKKEEDEAAPSKPVIVEAVVRSDSNFIGRSAKSFGLRSRYNVTLLGLARFGRVSRENVSSRVIQAGDVLLLTGQGATSPSILNTMRVIPVNRVNMNSIQPLRIALTIGLFAAAIIAAATGFTSFTVALAIAVAGYAAIGIIPAHEFYQQVEWPVIVMLACLLPIGAAFDHFGCTGLIAQSLLSVTAQYSPVVALLAMMVITMTLSDVLNSVATIVIMGPVSINIAEQLGVNPDTFLMGAAVSCSCAFLTPIGHKNNTLIMGPGGFKFSDYWRMGLPLEVVVLAVSIPMLLIVWPL
jgi:di/tricarboxylate transporter